MGKIKTEMNGNKVYFMLESPMNVVYKNGIFNYICQMICGGENVELDDIKIGTRYVEYLYPRQLIMFFSYHVIYDDGQIKIGDFQIDDIQRYQKNHLYSLRIIGEFFNKNHATVIHACKSILNYYDTDKYKHNEMDEYKMKLGKFIESIQGDYEYEKYEKYETENA